MQNVNTYYQKKITLKKNVTVKVCLENLIRDVLKEKTMEQNI